MNTLWTFILAATMSQAALASTTLVSNPYQPYPPSCGRLPDLAAPDGIESQASKFYDRQILVDATPNDGIHSARAIPMTLRAYRAPCDTFFHSLIWLELVLSAQYGAEDLRIPFPWLQADFLEGGTKYPVLNAEPNTWASAGWDWGREERFLMSRPQGVGSYFNPPVGDRRWVFLLDNDSPFHAYWNPTVAMTAGEYNSRFALTLELGGRKFTMNVPPTFDVVWDSQEDLRLPLSGRLSGNWVIPGASDQGVLLSFSERVLPDVPGVPNTGRGPMVVFLAHYTYDESGDMLWLTGAAQFEPGATEVTVPIEKVTNGQFRGNRRADRTVVGSVTLKTGDCNRLGFEYDYSGVGLGGGELDMQRLYSLEIAGHECRDYEARRVAMH